MPDPDLQSSEPTVDDRVLAESLLSPRAWPHAVHVPIRVIETHISRVFLTGDWAYKVKKTLRLPFLDYSTLDRRKACCEEELRLNRRTAPDLYAGVSAISGPREAPRVDGDGPPVEYAVRMRQFDPGETLDGLVDTGRIIATEIATLGRDLAALHATAARRATDAPYGDPEALRRRAFDDLDELAAMPVGDSATLAVLRRRVESGFALTRLAIMARRDAGHVRECHGDLHCGNVVRWNGRLVPFDAIEFDPALRWIDVANDLAFLSMDLAVRGRRDLRRVLLQAWFEASGDEGAIALLGRFETCRALVRAKVAGLRSRQPGGGAADRMTAERYLRWAVARTDPARPPLLVTCGYSGAGKTRLATGLASSLDALHLRSDVERKRLAGLAPGDDSRSPQDGGIYTPAWNARTYGRLIDCAASALAGGLPVIVDAASLRRAERHALLDVAAAAGVPVALLHCIAPIEVLRERIAARTLAGTDASEAGLATLERQPGYWEPFDSRESDHLLVVDTTAPNALARCLAALARAGVA